MTGGRAGDAAVLGAATTAGTGGSGGRSGGPGVTLLLPAVGAWLTALAVLQTTVAVAAVIAAVALASVIVALRVHRARGGRWLRVVVAVVGCVAASAASSGLRLATVHAEPLHRLAARGATATVTAVVTGQPAVRWANCPVPSPQCRTHVTVPVRLERVRVVGRTTSGGVPALVLADGGAAAHLVPGTRITVHGTLTTPYPHELLAAVVLAHGSPRVRAGPSGLRAVAAAVRARTRAAARVLPAPERALLPGLIDGDTSGVSSRVTAEFRATGMTHLLAASGANLAILIGAVVALARALRMGPVATGLLALPAIGLFVLACGGGPSVLRAAVTGTVALLALVTGRERAGLSALCVSVLLLVLGDPDLARAYGFALSVLATGGILLLAPRLRDRLSRRMPHRLAEALAVPLAAELCCAPVVAMLSAQISLVSVPANLLAEPAVGPATVLGALAAATAAVSMPVAHLLVWPAGVAVAWIATVARLGAATPHAVIPWAGGLAGGALCAVVLLVAVVTARRRPLRAIALVAVLVAVAVLATLRAVAPAWPPPGWIFVACDVGQGDGLVLNAGPGSAVVVDTGPDPGLMDSCLRRLRVRRVPLLVLSHYHSDHAGGVAGVLRGRGVGAALVDPDPVPRRESAAVTRLLAGRHIRQWVARPGMRWRIGPLEVSVLGPSPQMVSAAAGESEGAGPDDASIPLLVRSGGTRLLLTADLMAESERDMLDRDAVPRVDVLKVPHHGSANLDPGFFPATGARAAIISVGAHNSYGHPAPRTLAALRAAGMRVYRTDTDGDVAVVAGHGRTTIVTHPVRLPP